MGHTGCECRALGGSGHEGFCVRGGWGSAAWGVRVPTHPCGLRRFKRLWGRKGDGAKGALVAWPLFQQLLLLFLDPLLSTASPRTMANMPEPWPALGHLGQTWHRETEPGETPQGDPCFLHPVCWGSPVGGIRSQHRLPSPLSAVSGPGRGWVGEVGIPGPGAGVEQGEGRRQGRGLCGRKTGPSRERGVGLWAAFHALPVGRGAPARDWWRGSRSGGDVAGVRLRAFLGKPRAHVVDQLALCVEPFVFAWDRILDLQCIPFPVV